MRNLLYVLLFAPVSVAAPTPLYNAMVAPLARMEIRCAVWYRGCANPGVAPQRMLVYGWRKAFRNLGMPFVATQLAAYQHASPFLRLPDDFWMVFGTENTRNQ